MPTARANAMAANWNGKLAVIGGGTQYGATQATGVIELYDPASDTWTTSPLTVTPRAAGVALVDADRLYVIGGAVQSSLYGDPIVEIVTADDTCRAPALKLGRAQVVGGRLPFGLVVAGGWTAQLDTASVEGLPGAGSTWQPLPAMPTSRAGAASAVVNGALIVAGGGQYQGSWVYQNAVEVLEAD
jgi:N-acetylneuraminic acid mutarotase